MRNAYGSPEGEPERTSFVCACCGRTIVTAIEGLYYNPAVGSKQRFCDVLLGSVGNTLLSRHTLFGGRS